MFAIKRPYTNKTPVYSSKEKLPFGEKNADSGKMQFSKSRRLPGSGLTGTIYCIGSTHHAFSATAKISNLISKLGFSYSQPEKNCQGPNIQDLLRIHSPIPLLWLSLLLWRPGRALRYLATLPSHYALLCSWTRRVQQKSAGESTMAIRYLTLPSAQSHRQHWDSLDLHSFAVCMNKLALCRLGTAAVE